ncbi:GIY-YIG nuclease family protein [Arundinibacter roseus]|uniref:GIY-YIG nuclease family protein n=1 Tax=Arundinibacter roseus TaxID=2070510 RepID=A0A4V6P8I4_9BACT|nr:GIY-YIG nuclease family protein [Arundinibacter roseus]TDB60405.1 GIY-YIG nuclease family protein [Arundinibacter roseus]
MGIQYFDPTTERDTRSMFLKYRRKFIICPDQWETLQGQHETLDWKEVHFQPSNQESLPEKEGLYMFMASPKKLNASFLNYLLYVGETDNLRRRFGDYLRKRDSPKSGQYKVYTIIDDFPEHLHFRYIELEGYDMKKRRELETQFLIAFLPPINSRFPQQLQSIIEGAYGQ